MLSKPAESSRFLTNPTQQPHRSVHPLTARQYCPNFFSTTERAHANFPAIRAALIPEVTNQKGQFCNRYVSDSNDDARVYDRALEEEVCRILPAWDGLVLDLLEGQIRQKRCMDNARKDRALEVTEEERGNVYMLCWELVSLPAKKNIFECARVITDALGRRFKMIRCMNCWMCRSEGWRC
jgi:hypothetical protein